MPFTKAEQELINDIKGHLQSGNIEWEKFMDIAQYALDTVDDGDEWDEYGYEDEEEE